MQIMMPYCKRLQCFCQQQTVLIYNGWVTTITIKPVANAILMAPGDVMLSPTQMDISRCVLPTQCWMLRFSAGFTEEQNKAKQQHFKQCDQPRPQFSVGSSGYRFRKEKAITKNADSSATHPAAGWTFQEYVYRQLNQEMDPAMPRLSCFR